MHATTAQQIRDTLDASNAGRIHFGQVVGQLTAAGVESYLIDYRSQQATYHLGTDESLVLPAPAADVAIGQAFDGDAVRAAIRGAQQGNVMYPAFKRLTMQAGCIGYIVWLAGRHVSYLGRRGEVHVERFPD